MTATRPPPLNPIEVLCLLALLYMAFLFALVHLRLV